jgi:hypothetical protein
MAYSKYMEDCCASLTEAREYPTDALIRPLVESQKLARRIFDTFSYDDLNNVEVRGDLMIALMKEAFTRDLERLQFEVPQNLQQGGKSLYR